jgi:hypothetical protein
MIDALSIRACNPLHIDTPAGPLHLMKPYDHRHSKIDAINHLDENNDFYIKIGLCAFLKTAVSRHR